MKVKIEIAEGCTCYSCTINGIEYENLIDKESENYNPDFVYDVLEAMADEIYIQRKDNDELTTLIDDTLAFIKLENSQWFFERLFQFNENTKIIDSYHCEQCGDTVITRSLTLNINEWKLKN